jgi:hypothetical protein
MFILPFTTEIESSRVSITKVIYSCNLLVALIRQLAENSDLNTSIGKG